MEVWALRSPCIQHNDWASSTTSKNQTRTLETPKLLLKFLHFKSVAGHILRDPAMIPQTQVEIFISKRTEISRGLTLLSFPLSWGDYRGRIYSNIGTTGLPILCTVFASVYR